MIDEEDEDVARAIVERRLERGWTQLDVAERGGLSVDRVQAFEAGRGLSARMTTEARLEGGLGWAPGSIAAIRDGDDPEDIGPEAAAAAAGTAAVRRMLAARLPEARRCAGLTQDEVAARTGIGVAVLHKMENGRRLPSLTEYVAICRALSIDAGLLVREPDCRACGDDPPAGFTCNTCGTGGDK